MLATRSAVLALALLGAAWGTGAAGAELTAEELRARIEAAGGRVVSQSEDREHLNAFYRRFSGGAEADG